MVNVCLCFWIWLLVLCGIFAQINTVSHPSRSLSVCLPASLSLSPSPSLPFSLSPPHSSLLNQCDRSVLIWLLRFRSPIFIAGQAARRLLSGLPGPDHLILSRQWGHGLPLHFLPPLVFLIFIFLLFSLRKVKFNCSAFYSSYWLGLSWTQLLCRCFAYMGHEWKHVYQDRSLEDNSLIAHNSCLRWPRGDTCHAVL